MYKIAICDDEKIYISKIASLLIAYFNRINSDVHIETFVDADELIGSKPEDYDIIFLDVLMEGMDGIEVGKAIRKNGIDTMIVYISSYLEMAPKGYTVNAFRYVLKNELDNTFNKVIDEALRELKLQKEFITVEIENGSKHLELRKIVFIDSYKRYVEIHTKDEVFVKHISISELEKQLDNRGFLRVQRSYLVNMQHVTKLKNRIVYLDNGDEINCSKIKYRDIMDKYLDWKGKW